MRSRVTTTILASALGLSLALNASLVIGALRQADARPRADVDQSGAEEHCLLNRLELDEEQRERLARLRREMLSKRRAFWQRSDRIKAALADAICEEEVDRGRLDSLLSQYSEEQAGMQREAVKHLSRVHAMLRDDQRERFHELLRTEMFRGARPVPREAVEEP